MYASPAPALPRSRRRTLTAAHSSIRTRPAQSETKETTKVKISTDEEVRGTRVARGAVLTAAGQGNKLVNQYVILRKLGGGSYGKVKLAMNSDDNELYALCHMSVITAVPSPIDRYAMKICYKSMLRKRRQGLGTALDDVMREIAIMRRLNHPNVVKLYEVINDPSEDRLFLVMEYMENGAVQRDSRTLEALPEATVKKYLRDIVAGLDYLHAQRVIHRDLKHENLLVAADGTFKISDFGVSHAYAGDDDTLQQSAGSPAFLAPELCAAGSVPHGRGVDVWALGVTVYCLLFGKVPWMAENVLEIYEKIRSDPLIIPQPVAADLEDFLRRVLDKDPAKRLTLAEIRTHPWFAAATV